MCFKLDNGSELFSIQDMHRLRKAASGVMGSRSWASRPRTEAEPPACPGGGAGSCSCTVKCSNCRCREERPGDEK
jgi:hypothetical protein